MQQFETAHTRIRAALATERFWQAALALQRELKRNPYWHLQPRVPAGNPEGGQWTGGGGWSIGELGAVIHSLVIRQLARHLIPRLQREAERALPWLRRIPKRWLDGETFPAEDRFDRDTQRIAPPSLHRPGSPLIRFRSEAELRRFLGPAGPGHEWHHIVEQRLERNERFPVEIIQSTDNVISLPVEVHRRVSARMSNRDKDFGDDIRRFWVERMNFGDQYNHGLDLIIETLEEFGYDPDQF